MIDHEYEDKKVRFSPVVWRKLFKHMTGMGKSFYALLALVFVMMLADIFFPLLQGYLINNIIQPKDASNIWIFSLTYFLVMSVSVIVIVFYFYLCIKFEMHILQRLRNEIFQKFQKLEVAYFNNRSVGYLVAKTMSDTERIGNILAWGTLEIGYSFLMLIGIFIPMLVLNWKLALLVFTLLPISLFVSILYEGKLLRMNRKIRSINSQICGSLNEGITGAKTIKTLNVEDKMTNDFKEQTQSMYKYTGRYIRKSSMYISILFLLGSFTLGAVLAYGGHNVYHSLGMELWQLTSFVAYTGLLINPIMMFSEGITNLVANQANAERTLSILEQKPAIEDTMEVKAKYGDEFEPKYENWEECLGEIQFVNVSFKYPDSDRYILKDFNLTIPKGSSLALVGETGAGKTTIVNLICRFYEPTEGQILVDGIDIRERSQLWLARNLGYVLQTPHLFSGTVKDNIAFSKPDATLEEIQTVAAAVAADKVIAKLDKGYDSDLGEAGDNLSTGEKQLFTFARALLCDPKIVILDEATSSIDTETEALIQQAISKLLSNRTSILVAHRLSTIRNSDNILLIENGEVQESGNHKTLMKKRGRYYNLYTKLFELENAEKLFDKEEKKQK